MHAVYCPDCLSLCELEYLIRGADRLIAPLALQPIPNYFLYIILGISFLAVLSWLSGAV